VDLVDPYSDVIVVQVGDTFHVTAIQSGKSKRLVVDLGDGRPRVKARTGETIPVRYDVPGIYDITSRLGKKKLAPVTVEVYSREVPGQGLMEAMAVQPRMAPMSQSSNPNVGVSVGSVYAENGKFPMRFVASGDCYFQLKRYGSGTVWSGNITEGDTIVLMDGPDDGQPIWTLIKFVNGVQKGGTHVLSPDSPYRLQIEDIKVVEGPDYAPVSENVADTEWFLGTCHEAKLQVVPDPWWAIDPVCGPLYEWSGTDLEDSTGIEKDVSYDDGGMKDVYPDLSKWRLGSQVECSNHSLHRG